MKKKLVNGAEEFPKSETMMAMNGGNGEQH